MNEGFFASIKRELKRRRYDRPTIDAFLRSLRSFVVYFHPCHPRELSETDIRSYLSYLARSRTRPAHTITHAVAALRFLYGEVYGEPMRIRSNSGRRTPIFERDKLSGVITSIENPKHRALLALVYSAGVGPDEAVKLKPKDIDPKSHVIRLPGAHGRKNRTATLPDGTLEELQFYLKQFKPTRWLFAGQQGGSHLSPRSALRILRQAVTKAGMSGPLSSHLRRSAR
ncbi:MAG: hypothetical protein AUI33_14720 [Ignavibacteria bacterium 13_1_40CM_2_61_4]|nr:MAG: hypothetical protein AUI33_14720 [Ignavibacteria bacterium 13_1_40CM_2_61_4]